MIRRAEKPVNELHNTAQQIKQSGSKWQPSAFGCFIMQAVCQRLFLLM
jgi:hypothetical protein